MRAARALLGMDQRALAEAAGLSVPTIQRMEASAGVIRAHVDSLMKLMAALDAAGVELINEGAVSIPMPIANRPTTTNVSVFAFSVILVTPPKYSFG